MLIAYGILLAAIVIGVAAFYHHRAFGAPVWLSNKIKRIGRLVGRRQASEPGQRPATPPEPVTQPSWREWMR